MAFLWTRHTSIEISYETSICTPFHKNVGVSDIFMQNNFGLSSEAGVTRANLSAVAFYVGALSSGNEHNVVMLLGSTPGNQSTPLRRDRIYLSCLFIAWIKNCPDSNI